MNQAPNTQVTRKIPEISQIKREPWEKLQASRSLKPTVISLGLTQIPFALFFIVLLILSGFLADLSDNLGLPAGLFIIVFVIGIIVDVVYVLFRIAYEKSITYELQSNTFEVIKEFVDTRPGKLVISAGVFFRRMKIFPLTEYNSVEVYKDFFGNINNYGSILITNTKEFREPIRLRFVKSPNDFARIIQSLIDTTTSGMQLVDTKLPEIEGNGETVVEEQPLHNEQNDYIKS